MYHSSSEPTPESRSEPTEDQELSAVLAYLEGLPPELFTSRNSPLESFICLLQPTFQRIRDDAVRKMPERIRHVDNLSRIASKQTLSYLKAYFEFVHESLQDSHKYFMHRCISVTLFGAIYIVGTEVYPAIVPSKGQPFPDSTFLAASQVVIMVGLFILLGYTVLKSNTTRCLLRENFTYVYLLNLASTVRDRK